MKVYHINSYFATNSVHAVLVGALGNLGVEQRVALPSRGFQTHETDLCSYHAYQLVSPSARAFWFARYVESRVRVAQDCEWWAPDVIHSHTLITNGSVASKIAKRCRVPLVITIRNTDVNAFMRRYAYFRRRAASILEQCDQVVFLSEAYRRRVAEMLAGYRQASIAISRAVVIPSGIPDNWFGIHERNEIRNSSEEHRVKLLFVGRIDRNKNLETVLNALEILNKQSHRYTLTVVGDGPMRARLESQAPSCVLWRGVIKDRSQMETVYRASDVLVVPSFTESFGLVYAEAISQGTPVVYTRGEGFDGHLPEGMVGLAVDPCSPEDVAEKIVEIARRRKNMSANCLRYADRFRASRAAMDHVEVYNQVADVA